MGFLSPAINRRMQALPGNPGLRTDSVSVAQQGAILASCQKLVTRAQLVRHVKQATSQEQGLTDASSKPTLYICDREVHTERVAHAREERVRLRVALGGGLELLRADAKAGRRADVVHLQLCQRRCRGLLRAGGTPQGCLGLSYKLRVSGFQGYLT